MKTPLRFLKKTALAAVFAASAATVEAARSPLTWFTEDIDNYQTFTGNWSNTTDCSIDSGIAVDADFASPLTYTPQRASTEDNEVVITTTASFTSVSASLPDAFDPAPQTAITAADDNGTAHYYAYGRETNGGQIKWVELSGTPAAGTEVPVVITINYSDGTASFSIDGVNAGTVFLASTPSAAKVSSLQFAGNGTISGTFFATDGILPDYKVGNDIYVTSYAEALSAALAAGNNTAVAAWDSNNDDWASSTANGTVANPYEIPDLATLKAFQAAVANSNGLTYCYVQTADIALDAPWLGIGLQNGKDVYDKKAFDDAAFKGTYDGGNFTISNFQMAGGNLDYCGFFNSVSNAVIKNLKIQYKEGKLAADTASTTSESGATFVGVAKGATLQNLTSLSPDPAAVVFAGKGIGGIVGYLTCGSTVDSCTNNVSLTSYTNKAGGIAMIRQNGAASTISNCKNTGTISTQSSASDKKLQFGGIVGYVDHALVISNCENTAACKLLHNNTGTNTVTGVNKGNATVSSYTYASGHPVDGLNFATVDGTTATFVDDAALALNGSYKVMADGATATFAFAEAGTIAFDTALYTPTYAITAQGLDVTSSTSGTVTTYTAALPSYHPAVFLR